MRTTIGALAVMFMFGGAACVGAGAGDDIGEEQTQGLRSSCVFGNNLATCFAFGERTQAAARKAAAKALIAYIQAEDHACKPQHLWQTDTSLGDDGISWDGSATAVCVR